MRRTKRGMRQPTSAAVPTAFRFFENHEWRQFNEVVSRQLDAYGFEANFDHPGEVRLGNGITLGLLNLAQQCHAVDESDWAFLVADHLARANCPEEVPEEIFDALLALRVLLVPDDYLPPDIPTVRRTFAESVIATLVVDLPSSVRSVSPSDFPRWGLSEDEAWSHAWENTRSHAEPIDVAEVEIAGAPLVIVHGEHFYTASRIPWLEDLIGPCGPHGALVAMPRRSSMLVHRLGDGNSRCAFGPLVLNARLIHLEGPRSVSAHIYWWRNGRLRWVPTVFDETTEEIEFFAPPELEILLDH